MGLRNCLFWICTLAVPLLPAPLLAQITRGPFLQNVGADRATVCWATSQPSGGSVQVADASGREITTVVGQPSVTRQEVVVTGLRAGNTYRYSIRTEGMPSAVSEGSITTAPPPGAPISFVVWGDTRSNPKMCEQFANLILKSGATMSVHSGDLVGRGANAGDWDRMFFSPCREMLRSVPIWTAIGNHDRNLISEKENRYTRQAYVSAFALPGNERYYSFDYGDAHFVVLDVTSDAWNDKAQYEFVRRDLKKTRARWKIAVLHYPLFSVGSHDIVPGITAMYAPLFARSNVDLIVTGHDHDYQLSHPMIHRYEPRQRRPYVHLVAGGGGANLHTIRSSAIWFNRGKSAHHIVLCRIEGEQFHGKVVTETGETLDEFTIDRSKPAANVVVYELAEMDRLYRKLLPCDAAGEKAKPVALDTSSRSGVLRYKLFNSLRDPVRITFHAGEWDGLIFKDPAGPVELAPQDTRMIEVPFAVMDVRRLKAGAPPRVDVRSPLGDMKTPLPYPPLTRREATTVPATSEPDEQNE